MSNNRGLPHVLKKIFLELGEKTEAVDRFRMLSGFSHEHFKDVCNIVNISNEVSS